MLAKEVASICSRVLLHISLQEFESRHTSLDDDDDDDAVAK